VTKFFSKSTGGFYPADMRNEYTAAGSWPADAVEVTDGDEDMLRVALSDGSTVDRDSGVWVITPKAPMPLNELKNIVLDEARALRTKLFLVVDGLQVSALVSGNTADAQAIEAFKIGARNITSVNLGTVANEEAMRNTVQAAYGVLVMAAPVSVKLAFAQALQ
jgi:hypothetical protein